MSKMQSKFSQVFIVGVGRSGTTLLRAILNSHSKICVTPEAHFVFPLLRYRKHYETPTGFDEASFVEDLRQAGSFEHWHMSEREVEQAVSSAKCTSDAVGKLYTNYAALEGKELAIDKTPSLTQHIEFLSKLYPRSRFVHMIRDGRDVAISQYLAGWAHSVDEAAVDWAVRSKQARSVGKKLGAKRYFELRYEDLVEDPESQVKQLCGWLDLRYEQDMIKQSPIKAKQLLASVYNPKLHQRLLKPIQMQKPKGTAKQRKKIEEICSSQLKQLGYISSSKTNISAKLLFAYWYIRKFGIAKFRHGSWSWRLPTHY